MRRTLKTILVMPVKRNTGPMKINTGGISAK